MSVLSELIKNNACVHALADEAADEIELLEARIERLETCLKECDIALEMLSSLGPVVRLRAKISELVTRKG